MSSSIGEVVVVVGEMEGWEGGGREVAKCRIQSLDGLSVSGVCIETQNTRNKSSTGHVTGHVTSHVTSHGSCAKSWVMC